MKLHERRILAVCCAIISLVIGIIVILSGMRLTALAAGGGPGSWMLTNVATASYSFGAFALLLGVFMLLKALMMIEPGQQQEYPIHQTVPQGPPNGRIVVCPDCGNVLTRELGMVKPDGSVICSKCFKKFVPLE